ncbi:GSCFA domain-containing protein [Salipiger aestuarii]|uniref:GSCFA domain-containing protein n=1 Tax=Salipiger aestuarii TaxID=568098 RepID=UPI001CC2C719|nr:GSCFA domain-containing protein [Salipiger aestuarii]
MIDHPYRHLPENRYWKQAIAQRAVFDLADLYKKKFFIDPSQPIATAGSCFAQHIAKRLQRSGYRYMDAERPPFNFPTDSLEKFGYGLYSARFGNVYTARQLLQLAQRAFGDFQPIECIVEDNGRIFDLLRPTIQSGGFACHEEYNEILGYHFRAVRHMFTRCNLFVFTFGLTEAWVDKRDGTVFPICPGTAAGEYNPEKYEFKNFTASEILSDMKQFIALVRNVNPDVRFLFTVSPVPLVATAEDRHVLVSTVYSKSVLRTVAGELEQTDPLIDYFPSYEIISGVPSRSMFFEPDMRTVHTKGVDLVMEHFFREHPPVKQSQPAMGGETEERDPVCDELFLKGQA